MREVLVGLGGAGLGAVATHVLVKQRELKLFIYEDRFFVQMDNSMVWVTQGMFDSAIRVMESLGFDTTVHLLPVDAPQYCDDKGIRYLYAFFTS